MDTRRLWLTTCLAEIDRKTANEKMKQAGEQFGFKTKEVEGMVLANMADASKVLGETSWGLSKLLSAYHIMTYKVGWFLPEVVNKLRKYFNLNPKDSKTTFIPGMLFCLPACTARTKKPGKLSYIST